MNFLHQTNHKNTKLWLLLEFCDFVGVLTETINIMAFESGKDLTCNRNTSREECSLSTDVS